MSNQVCGNCGHTNRPGVLFCENCGTSLTGKAAVGATKSFEEENAQTSTREQVAGAGTDYFLANSTLRIEIEGGPEPILIKPKQELIFGRRDPATGAMPDIDLTPYAGYRMGVSRRHAAIRTADENHLDVWDLGSSNGTFLNGQRLNAHRPYRLRDGDRLRLGQMIIRVLFQPPEAEAEGGAAEAVAVGEGAPEDKPTTHVPGSRPSIPTAAAQPLPDEDLLKTKKVDRDVVKSATDASAEAPAASTAQSAAEGTAAPAVTEAPAAETTAAAETPAAAETTAAAESPAAADASAEVSKPAAVEAPDQAADGTSEGASG